MACNITYDFSFHQEEQVEEVLGKVHDAISFYKKRSPPVYHLIIEAQLKLARWHVSNGKRKEASDILMEVYDQSPELPISHQVVTPSQNILVTLL